MKTLKLKKFAQHARRQLIEQVAARLDLVLQTDSAELRGQKKAVNQLKDEVARLSHQAVVERVAYTWFNRFCALRFMDVNRYTAIGVVSPEGDFTQPEILQEAKQGHIDEELQVDSKRVFDLLAGRIPSSDPQQEAYRLLLVAECNRLNHIMPFMFQRISDYTELLIMDDLLSEKSVLTTVREALTEENCQDVEVIGWLYQFYISEKKDQVFDGLKKNKKITPENIPAATQLFTPHWIVRYLVENSLGRLWMLNNPDSNLVQYMDYYIKPEEPETDFLQIRSPEELKICDPACGSGHMLTYAFDLLYLIYEENGYGAKEIPGLILTNNLYGIEIDKRAGELAAFALTMKARAKYRRYFRKTVQPNICVLQNVSFQDDDLRPYIEVVGRDLFTNNLQTLLHQFEEADNFGSLIRPAVEDVGHVRRVIEEKQLGEQVAFAQVHPKVIRVLEQAEYLSSRYHVVVANPPYMGKKNMNGRLQDLIGAQYKFSCSDFFAAFIENSFRLRKSRGFTAMLTMDSWMFGDEYTEFRKQVLSQNDIRTLAHLGPHAFEEIKGEVVQVTAFVFGEFTLERSLGVYFDLTMYQTPERKREALESRKCSYVVSSNLYPELPRNVYGYFVSSHTRKAFKSGIPLKNISEAFTGLQTGNNERFIRRWSEISFNKICFKRDDINGEKYKAAKWFPYVKGSNYRKWYGNHEFILDWQFDGAEIKAHRSSTVRNQQYYFCNGLAYNNISNKLSVRWVDKGQIFDQKNSMFFSALEKDNKFTMCFLHSKVVIPLLRVVAPKDFGPGSMKLLPIIPNYKEYYVITELADSAVELAKQDWNASESSWDFRGLSLLNTKYRQTGLKNTYQSLRNHWREMTLEMQRLEQENNNIFTKAYGLQCGLESEALLNDITLTCNPHYRYGAGKTEKEYETFLKADTMREFLSYAVGCMFGRYSLDKPGLILANQGETLADYLAQVPNPSFKPDDDNVIPILDSDWFMDDIVSHFKTFLKVTFGEEHYEENLQFIEEAIGRDIRNFFLKEFYADHLKRYKKRPIYWLFSSPKGSFNALIYMHRYRPDTVSVILNDYLREFRSKLMNQLGIQEDLSISASASKSEKTRALRQIEKLKKTIEELTDYEKDILYPLATEQIEIDLDDGVKVNYKKFGKALKKVAGLS